MCTWGAPQRGSKEQTDCFERRIAVTLRPNQFRHCCSAVFVVLSLVAETRNNTSPKESVSYASCRVVLVMREPIRIVFIVCLSACCCSCTVDIADAVPTFENPLFTKAYNNL